MVRGGGSPRRPTAPSRAFLSGCFLWLLPFNLRGRDSVDFNPPRLHCLRYAPDKVDLEKAVLERRSFHLDMICEVEPALEGTESDALVEVLRMIATLSLLTVDGQQILLGGDIDFVGRKARDRQQNAERVLPGPHDVVVGVAVSVLRPLQIVKLVEHTFE